MKAHASAIVMLIATILTTAAGLRAADLDALPQVPDGFKATLFAREPDLLHPAALAFDAKGRLFVGGGPQFRKPTPDTPPDSIKILIDKDGDGVAETIKTFATGFNCIQALAWKGGDLYVANCPDVTIVRDTDGDDVADEYQLVFTGLGHLRHGLHGFNFGPDGKLYMTQGNSRAQKHAPKAWRDLMHIDSDEPDNQPINKVFKPDEYKRSYIGEWPSSEGGILRCDPDGHNLEIWSRGYRNPWDAAFDDEFNWLATDNDDGPEHDRIIAPFHGAHFGKLHPWAYSWTGKDNPPTVPASGLFPSANGSGVGVVFYNSTQFPQEYRGVFLIGDWTRECIYTYRRKWDGALLTGELATFITAGKALFRPTDIEVGPDGALYIAGWGERYGSKWAPYGGGDQNAKTNEGRVFKVWYDKAPLVKWDAPKRGKPYEKWTVQELIEDLGHPVPVWRVNAQDELIRRDQNASDRLAELAMDTEQVLTKTQRTWAMWTMSRIETDDDSTNRMFATWARVNDTPVEVSVQCLRILASRKAANVRQSIAHAMSDLEPRIRLEAAQAMRRIGIGGELDAFLDRIDRETDRIAFYAMWRALGEHVAVAELKMLLKDERGGVRRAALLALLEQDALSHDEVLPLTIDADDQAAAIAQLWMEKAGKAGLRALAITPDGAEFFDPITVTLTSPLEGAVLHYTLDGSEPTAQSPRYDKPLTLKDTTMLRAAIVRNGTRFGAAVSAEFLRLTEEEWKARLILGAPRPASGKPYKIVEYGAQIDATVYIDRKYTFKQLPDVLIGASYIQTSNEDDKATGDAFLTFTANHPVDVHIAHDNRTKQKPSWLKLGSADGFTDTELDLETTDTTFSIYHKRFDAGVVTLGGNVADKAGPSSMYQVFIRKAGARLAVYDTTMANAAPLLDKGDAARGRAVFFEHTVGCARCHRLEDRGVAVGPDLADAGLRLKPDKIALSILDPNAEVIEGFVQHMVETNDGDRYFGMMRAESGKSLTLYTLEGRKVVIAKGDIAEHRVLATSAMPTNFGKLLTPQDVADLAAYLMTQKKKVE